MVLPGNNPNTAAAVPSKPAPTYEFDFESAVMGGKSLPDIGQAVDLMKVPIKPPSDAAGLQEKFPNLAPEKAAEMADYIGQEYYKFKNDQYNTNNATVNGFPQTDWYRRRFPQFTSSKGPSFMNIPTDPVRFTTYPGGAPIQFMTEQQLASTMPFAKDGDKWVPTKQALGSGEYLQWEYGDPTKGEQPVYWRVLGKDEVGIGSKMRSVFGDEQMESSWKDSIGRGLWSGTLPLMSKGLGSLVGVIQDLGLPEDKVLNKDFEAKMVNWGNYMTHTNMDEKERAFSEWNSFLYNTFNGVGQVLGVIATGYLGFTGSTMIGATEKLASKLAMRMSMGLGSVEAAGGQREYMRSIGIPDHISAKYYFPYAIATYASESFLGANITQRMGGNLAKRMLAKDMKKQVVEGLNDVAGKEVIAETGKNLKDLTAAGKESFMKRAWGKVMKSQMSFKEFAEKNATTKTFAQSFEEGFEETVEGGFNAGISAYFNSWAQGMADTVNQQFQGNTFIENKEITFDPSEGKISPETHPYKMIDKNGSTKYLTNEDYSAIKNDMDFAEGVSDGTIVMPTAVNMDEAGIAFISTFITGGLGNYTGLTHQKKVKTTAMGIANMLEQDPSKEAEFLQAGEDLIKDETMGKDFVDDAGNVITYGSEKKSQGRLNWEAFKGQIDYYRDIIRRYGLRSPETIAAISNAKGPFGPMDGNIMQAAINTAAEIDKLSNEIAKANADPATKPEVLDALKKKLEGQQKRMDYIIKPKDLEFTDKKGNTITAKKSQMYSDMYIFAAMAEDRFNTSIRREAEGEIGIKSTEPNYDSELNKLIAQKKKFYKGDPVKYAQRIMQNKIYDIMDQNKVSPLWEFERLSEEEKTAFLEKKTNANHWPMIELYELAYGFAVQNHNDALKTMQKIEKSALTAEFKSIGDEIADIFGTGMAANATDDDVMDYVMRTLPQSERLRTMTDKINAAISTQRFMQSDLNTGERSANLDILNNAKKTIDSFKTLAKGTLGEESDMFQPNSAFNSVLQSIEDSINREPIPLSPISLDKPETNPQPLVDMLRQNAVDMLLRKVTVPGIGYDLTGSVAELITSFESIAGSENASFASPGNVRASLDAILNYLERIENYMHLNKDFFQDNIESSDETKEHSKILNDTQAKINEAQKKYALDQIRAYRKRAMDLIPLVQDTQADKAVFNFRAKLGNISMAYNMFTHFLEDKEQFLDAEAKKAISGNLEKIREILEGKVDPNDKTTADIKDFDNMFKLFVEAVDKKSSAVMQGLEDRLIEIEKFKIKIEDGLSGKLEGILKNLNENTKIYTLLEDFRQGSIFNKDQTIFEGQLTPAFYQAGLLNFNAKVDTLQSDVYYYYTMTFANRINKMGQEGRPKSSEFYQAYRDMLAERLTEDGMVEVSDFVSSYEQELVLWQIIGFLDAPSNEWMFTESKLQAMAGRDETLINNSLYVRGYGGTGKSTQIVMDFLKIYKKLTGNRIKITVIIPNDNLRSNYLELVEKGIIHKDDIEFIMLDQIGTKKPSNNIVILDEGSVVPRDLALTLKTTMDKVGKPLIILGDDGQTNPMFEMDGTDKNRLHDPTFPLEFAGERTIPITKVWRTTQSQFFNLQQFYRSIRLKKEWTEYFPMNWKFSTVDKKKIGGEYVDSERKVIQAFIDHANANLSDEQDAILIVLTTEDKKRIIADYSELRTKHLQDLIKVVEYDYNEIQANPVSRNDLVSGIQTQNAFVAIDFIGALHNGEKFFNLEIESDTVQFSRAALTAISRQKRYLLMIGDETMSKKVDDAEPDTRIVGWKEVIDFSEENRENVDKQVGKNGRLHILTEGKTTYTKEGGGIDPVITIGATDPLTEHEVENVRKKTETKVKLIQMKQPDNTSDHLTDVMWNALHPINTNTDENNNSTVDEFDREQARVYKHLIRTIFDGDSIEEVMKIAEPFFNLYAARYKEESLTEDSRRKLLQAMINSIVFSYDVMQVINKGIPVVNPGMRIDMGGPKKLQGFPAMISIVGYTKGKNNRTIPIVDVYDFNIVRGPAAPTEYTKLKLAGYIAMLGKLGFKVNQVKVFNMDVHIQDRATQHFEPYVMSDEDKTEYIPKAVSILEGKKDITVEDYVASPNEMSEQERIINNSEESRKFMGSYFIENKTGVPHRVEQFTSKAGHIYVSLRNTRTNKATTILKEDWLKDYSWSTSQRNANRFNEEGKRFMDTKTKGSTYSTTMIFHSPTGEFTLTYDPDNFFDSEKNILLKAKHIVQRVSTKYPLKRKIYRTGFTGMNIDKATGKVVESSKEFVTPSNMVVTNELFDADIENILKSNLDLVKLLTGKNEVTAEAIALFKQNGLHIISVEGEPEYNYGMNGEGVKVYAVKPNEVTKYLNEADDTKAEKQLDLIFDDNSFKDSISDNAREDMNKGDEETHRLNNIAMNQHRLRVMRKLNLDQSGEVEVSIIDIIEGRLIYSRNTKEGEPVVKSYNETMKMLELSGLKAEMDPYKKVRIERDNSGEKTEYFILVSRLGLGNNIRINFSGRRATGADYSKMITEVEQALLGELGKVIDEIDSYTAEERLATPEEFKSQRDRGWQIMDNLEAIQFLQHNRSYIKKELGKNTSIFHGILHVSKDGFIRFNSHNVGKKGRDLKNIINNMKALAANDSIPLEDRTFFMPVEAQKEGEFITDNLITRVIGVTQPNIFSREKINSDPDREELDDYGLHKYVDNNEDDTITINMAREQIRNILGNVVDNDLFFEEGFIIDPKTGKAAWGRVEKGIIRLSNVNGRTHRTGGRHEAMHYVTLYLVNAENRGKIIQDARNQMSKAGITDLSYRNTMEWLADTFEDKSYRGSNFLVRFFNWLRAVVKNLFGIRNDVNSLMWGADLGFLRNAQPFPAFDEDTFYKYVDNDLNSPANMLAMRNLFGSSVAGWNHLVNGMVKPEIIKYSLFGKYMGTMNETMGGTVNSVVEYFKSRRDQMDKTRSYTVTYVITEDTEVRGNVRDSYDENGNYVTGNNYSPEQEQFIAIKNLKPGQKVVQKIKSIEFMNPVDYYNALSNSEGSLPYNEDNKRAVLDYKKYHMGRNDVIMTLIQAAMPSINVEELVLHPVSGSRGQGIVKNSNEEFNPADSRSQYMDMILSAIPYWSYNTLMDKSSYKTGGSQKVNNVLLDKILMDSFAKMDSLGMQHNFENWWKALRMMMEESGNTTYQNTIFSFLIEYGNAEGQIGNSINNMINPRSPHTISGVGIYKIITDPDIQNEVYRAYPGTTNQKIKEWRIALKGMFSYYDSLTPRSKSNGRFTEDVPDNVTLTSLDETLIKANLRNSMRNKLYLDQRGGLQQNTINEISDGHPGQKYLIMKDSIYRIQDGEKILIYGPDKKILDDSEVLPLFRFLGMRDVTVPVSTMIYNLKDIKTKKSISDNLFHMMLSIEATAKMMPYVKTVIDGSTSELSDTNFEMQVSFPDEVNEYLQTLAKFYKNHGTASSIFIRNAELLAKNKEPKPFKANDFIYPGPEDLWMWVLDIVAPAIKFQRAESASRIVMNVEHEKEYSNVLGSTLSSVFRPGSNIGETLAKEIRNQFETTMLGKKLTSPIAKRDADGKYVYLNPILNRKISFDTLQIFGGIQASNRGVKYANMNMGDMFSNIFEAYIYYDVLSEGRGDFQKLTSFSDPFADKPIMPIIRWWSTNEGGRATEGSMLANIKKTSKSIREITFNETVLVNILSDFLEYYNNVREMSLKKWNDLRDRTQIGAQRAGLTENEDYVVDKKTGKISHGPAILQPGNPYMKIDIAKFRAEKSSVIKYKMLKESFQDRYNLLTSEMVKYDYALPENYDSALKDGDTNWSKSRYVDGTYMGEEEGHWHPIKELAFWSHHISNAAISHLARGNEYTYSDITDYVKRGAGLVAPGTVFSPYNEFSDIGEKARVLVMDDLEDMDTLFGSKVNATDGYAIFGHFQEMLRRDSGGLLGNVGQGALKTVNFYYDPVTGQKTYYKFAQYQVSPLDFRNNLFMKQMTLMMLGPVANLKITKNRPDPTAKTFADKLLVNYTKAMSEIVDYVTSPGGLQYRKLMIDYVVFKNSVKSGVTKVVRLKGTTFATAEVPMELNNEDNVIYAPNHSLRLQTVTTQNTHDPHKTIPTQFLSVLGAGLNNAERIRALNNALAEMTLYGVDEFNKKTHFITDEVTTPEGTIPGTSGFSLSKTKRFLMEIGMRSIYEHQEGGKFSRILMNLNIHPDVARSKHVNGMINYLNKFIKPSMPGQNYIQAPSGMFMYFDEKGRPHLAEDLGLDHDRVEMEGYTRRQLNPIRYINKKGEDITKREDINKNSQFIPAEVIIPFYYMQKFGITEGLTLYDSMFLTDGTNTENLYRGRDELTEAFEKRVDDFFDKADTDLLFSISFSSEAKSKQGALIKKGATDSNSLKENLKNYYKNYNRALDIFAVRIPTTNASSAFAGRVVSFATEVDNTIYISPRKNILDGADWDIDSLSIYFRAFDTAFSPTTDKMKQYQNVIFESMWDYFKDWKNAENILTSIDMTKIRQAAQTYETAQFGANDLGSMIAISMINQSGRKLVGHFANLENFNLKLLHLSSIMIKMKDEEYAKFFGDFAVGKDQKKKPKTIPDMMSFLANIINAATDNAKEGGILGKLNANEETSPIINGMVMAGYTEDQVLEIFSGNIDATRSKEEIADLTDLHNELKKASLDTYHTKKRSKKDFSTTKHIGQIAKSARLIKFADMGESLRRFGQYFVSLQQELPTNTAELERLIFNIEFSLGMSLEDYTKMVSQPSEPVGSGLVRMSKALFNFTPTDQINNVNQNIKKITQSERELSIRSQLNIPAIVAIQPNILAYITALSALKQTIRETFTVDQQQELRDDVAKSVGKDRFIALNDLESLEDGIEGFIIGQFLSSEFQNVRLPLDTKEIFGDIDYQIPEFFNMSNSRHRALFVLLFPFYVEQLKVRKGFESNSFVKRLRIDSRHGNFNHSFVEFSESNNLTELDKAGMTHEFVMMPSDDQEVFRVYQALIYGFQYRNGSFVDVIDESTEKRYSRWIKNFKMEDIINDIDIPREIIGRETRLADFAGSDFESGEEYQRKGNARFTLGDLNKDKRPTIYEKTFTDGREIDKQMFLPYFWWMNSYSNRNTITNEPYFDNVTIHELAKLAATGSITITGGNFSGIYLNTPNNRQKARKRNMVLDGEIVSLPDGSKARATFITNSTAKLTRLGDLDIASREIGLNSHEKAMSYEALQAVLGIFKRAFPNINVRLTDNSDRMNSRPGDNAYIDSEGTVWINTDRVNFGTPVHEFMGHIFMMALEQSNPALYQQIYNRAEQMLRQDTAMLSALQNAYPTNNFQDNVREFMATMMGWKSQEAIEESLMKYSVPDTADKAKSIWSWFKNIWTNLQKFINGVIKGSTGIQTTDIYFSNFDQFVNDLVKQMMSGRQMTNMTSSDVAKLMRIKTLSSVDLKQGQDLKGIANVLINGKMNDLTEGQKIARLKSIIGNNDFTLPARYTGKEEKFLNLNDTSRFQQILKEGDRQAKVFNDNLLKWISGGAIVGDAVDIFGRRKSENAIYVDAALTSLKEQMSYSQHTKYYRYSDLKNMPEFKHLYNEEFLGYNPIVAIEYADDKFISISIFDVTNEYLDEKNVSNIDGNIIREFLPKNNKAVSRGITLTNKEYDVRRLTTFMLAQHMMNVDPKVQIFNSGVINVTPNKSYSYWNDPVRMRNNMDGISKTPEFMDWLEDSKVKELFGKKIRDPQQDYMKMLAAEYEHANDDRRWKFGMGKIIKNEQLSIQDKVEILSYRLKDLLQGRSEEDIFSTAEKREIFMIFQGMLALKHTKGIDGQLNDMSDIDNFQKVLYDGNSVKNDYVQAVRDLTLTISGKIVHEVNQVKKTMYKENGIFELVRQVYAADNNVGLTELGVNITARMFEKLFVKMKDKNGNYFNTGLIYWTNNENEVKEITINGKTTKIALTETEKAVARQAKQLNIDPRLLQAGKMITEVIENNLIEMIYHTHMSDINNQGFWNFDTKEKYTKDDAKRELYDPKKINYHRGMTPLMNRTASEFAAEGNFKAAINKRVMDITDIYTLFDETSAQGRAVSKEFIKMNDMFFYQFGYNSLPEHRTPLGYDGRLNSILGVKMEFNDDGSIGYEVTDQKKNKEISMDMDKILNYFTMSTVRRIHYETEVLPVINGIKIYLMDMKMNKGVETSGMISYINLFTKLGIKGERDKLTGQIGGLKIDNTITTMQSIAAPLVLAGNINIGMISATTNFMYAFVEGIANTFVDRGMPQAKHLIPASALFFKDFKKMSQLAIELQVINMTEYDLMESRIRQKTEHYIFSSHYANWTNWASDFYARGVLMVAQMLYDGSYDAYSLNDKGELQYDWKKDKRWSNKDSDPEQNALYENMKNKLSEDGLWGQTADKDLVHGYDLKSSRRFKFLADKYVIGAYDDKTKGMLANFLVGRMFMMFKTWFVTRFTNAFEKGGWSEEGGRYVIEKDMNGELVPKWERLWVEGYLMTIARFMADIVRDGKMPKLSEMNQTEKYNLIKAIINVSLFLSMMILYTGLVGAEDDKDKTKEEMNMYERFLKTIFGDAYGAIPDWRFIRNFRYAYSSILVIPQMFEMVTHPFAFIDIYRNMITDGFGRVSLNNYPGKTAVETVIEPFRGFAGGDVGGGGAGSDYE